jgi:VanZ family protein
MAAFKQYAMTAVVILVVISIYNSFLKTYLPTGIRSIVGLG